MMVAVYLSLLQTMSAADAEALARAELGDRAAAAETLRVEAIEWPSAALGCPEKGYVYAQRVIPGFRVLVSLEGTLYRIHVGDGSAVLCGQIQKADGGLEPGEVIAVLPEPVIAEPSEPLLAQAVDDARKDLAERLSVEAVDVELLEVETVVWPDRGLGCPHPEISYQQVPVDGVRIRLRVAKRVYHYHGGGSRKPFLCESPERDPYLF